MSRWAGLVLAIWAAVLLRDITPELARWLADRLEAADDQRIAEITAAES